ncbi:MAG: PilZ domain-containing protein [Planctomycetes bacterium]|nr:PilZ domain-containing protein [Planctomycetota bacterium]
MSQPYIARLTPASEHRVDPRINANLVVQIRDAAALSPTSYTPAVVGDVSGGGVKLLSRGTSPLPSLLHVEFFFPKEGMRLRLAARRRWHRLVGGVASVTGFQFLSLSAGVREQLLAAAGRRSACPTPAPAFGAMPSPGCDPTPRCVPLVLAEPLPTSVANTAFPTPRLLGVTPAHARSTPVRIPTLPPALGFVAGVAPARPTPTGLRRSSQISSGIRILL